MRTAGSASLLAARVAGCAVAVRRQEGDHVSAHERALPLRRPRPGSEADGRDAAAHPRLRRRRTLRHEPEQLPLGRVVNDAKVDDHHAIIPTDVDHDIETFSPDERRIFDLVAKRFLAVFHPPARYARTTIITLVEEERFRTRGKVTLEAGWRAVYGLQADAKANEEDPESAELPQLEEGQAVKVAVVESEAKETRPPARYTEATLLSAMETAGKLIDDEELREAMKNAASAPRPRAPRRSRR